MKTKRTIKTKEIDKDTWKAYQGADCFADGNKPRIALFSIDIDGIPASVQMIVGRYGVDLKVDKVTYVRNTLTDAEFTRNDADFLANAILKCRTLRHIELLGFTVSHVDEEEEIEIRV